MSGDPFELAGCRKRLDVWVERLLAMRIGWFELFMILLFLQLLKS